MIEGLDVSVFQQTTPSLVGKDFLFARASIGTKTDPMFATHIANAKKAGVVTGAYHFGTSASVSSQVDTFLNAAIAANVDLLVLDLEGSGSPMTAAQAKTFLDSVKAHSLKKVGLYHSLSGYPQLGQEFNWVAFWSPNPPSIPWLFWQNGPDHGIDHNYFMGTREQLNAFAGVSMARFVQANGYNTDSTKLLDVAKGHPWKYLDGSPGGTFSDAATIQVFGLVDSHSNSYLAEIGTGVPYADKQTRTTLVVVESSTPLKDRVPVPTPPVNDLPSRQAQWDKDAAAAIGPRPTT